MKAPQVFCHRCGGFGKHAMPRAYAEVYELLDAYDWTSTTALLERLNHGRTTRYRVAQTAFCNRLAWLKREGFAESRASLHNARILEWRAA